MSILKNVEINTFILLVSINKSIFHLTINHVNFYYLDDKFHVKLFLDIHINHKALEEEGVLALNVVSLHHTVVLDVGVTPVLVILHEADLVTLHLSLNKVGDYRRPKYHI